MFRVKELKKGTQHRREQILSLVLDWIDCEKCPIGCFTQHKVLGDGVVPAKYLFVGEAPGREEDKKGIPFVGRSGVLLRKTIRSVSLRRNFFLTNVVACRPSKSSSGPNRAPTLTEIDNCNTRLRRTIEIVNPSVIITVGKVADIIIDLMRDDFKCRVESIWHPAYVLRNGGVGGKKHKQWVRQIKKILG